MREYFFFETNEFQTMNEASEICKRVNFATGAIIKYLMRLNEMSYEMFRFQVSQCIRTYIEEDGNHPGTQFRYQLHTFPGKSLTNLRFYLESREKVVSNLGKIFNEITKSKEAKGFVFKKPTFETENDKGVMYGVITTMVCVKYISSEISWYSSTRLRGIVKSIIILNRYIKDRREELYRPHGIKYLEAKENFESNAKRQKTY
jgi:hypothetical protein